MAIFLVKQLRFTRAKWQAGLEGVTLEEGLLRAGQMNSIGWMVGHLAYHEALYWWESAQGESIPPEAAACAWGQPASTPPLDEMTALWDRVTAHADRYLDSLTDTDLTQHLSRQGKWLNENVGTMFHRLIYHYWFHLGEMQAVRQGLGHQNLPSYVGSLPPEAYYPE